MKIYQIAGKQYAASENELYEKVPEFSPLQQLIVDEERSTRLTQPLQIAIRCLRLSP
jgi:hypothetical protein